MSDMRLRLGQTTASNSNWTDAEVLRALNLAQDYVASVGRVIEKLDTVNGGALRFAAPANFIVLKDNSWLLRNGAEVKPIPRASMDTISKIIDRMTSQSVGQDKFVIGEDGGKLIIAPILYVADSAIVSFYAYADTIDSASECEYDASWEYLLELAAKVILLEKISSPDLPLAIQERDKTKMELFQLETLKPQLSETGP